METNKCVIDNSDFSTVCGSKLSSDSDVNKVLEIPEVKNQIGGYLDLYWCEHGQQINHILNCTILTQISKKPIQVEFIIRKINCGCRGTLIISIHDHDLSLVPQIKLETHIYPIPFRNPGIIEVGVDEVGRGCLFGPVTSGAVIWPPDLDNETTRRLIKDSKKLNETQREEAYAYILENVISWGVASLDNREIDRTNILRAAIKSMHMAIDETYIVPQHIIADGNSFNIYIDRHAEPVNHTTIVEGDNKYYSIAAASIIAKVTRDREMIKLEKENPELIKYGISSNKGYGAAIHLQAIKTYGLTEWHRRSFGICKRENGVEMLERVPRSSI